MTGNFRTLPKPARQRFQATEQRLFPAGKGARLSFPLPPVRTVTGAGCGLPFESNLS
jgi:hypothetical protein